MTSVTSIAGVLGVVIGGVVIAANVGILAMNLRKRRADRQKYVSSIPLVGPTCISAALFALGTEWGVSPWWFALAWAIDPGTWIVVAGAVLLFRRTDNGED